MNLAEKLAQAQLDYYNAHDINGFSSVYHEDVEIFRLDDQSLILRGREALIERYTERFKNPDLHAQVVNRMVIGDQVIDHEHVKGIVEGEIVKAVAIYKIKDDLIRTVWFLYE